MSGRRRKRSIGKPARMRPGKRRQHPRPFQLVAQIFRKHADQNRNHIARRFDPGDQWRDLRLQLRQFAPRQGDVELVGDAAIVALLDEVDIFLRHLDVLAQHHELHLQRAQIEIGAGHVGDQRNQHHVAGGDGGVDVILRRFDRAAEPAENVDLPGGIETDDVDDLRHAGAGSRRRRASARRGRGPNRCPVPQPPPALASADGSAAPMSTASCARACCKRSSAISNDGLAAMARSTNELSSRSCSVRHHFVVSTGRLARRRWAP